MDRLNNEVLQKIPFAEQAAILAKKDLPEKVLQFGEGNFLRAFIDWMIQQMNKQGLFNGRVVAIQPTPHGKVVPKLAKQDHLYTVSLRGIENGETIDSREVISSISRAINPYTDWLQVLTAAAKPEIVFVFSNTTEAGLDYLKEEYVPDQSPVSFPGKLTACLYHRFTELKRSPAAGWTIIPCELIENNDHILRERVLQIASDWGLPAEFSEWVKQHNRFCNTLVDRIVPGYPKDNIDSFLQEMGYEDSLLTVGEPYHLLVIEADAAVQEAIPFDKAGLNVHWADVKPFRDLKVRILNGAHTMMCTVGHLAGKKTVAEVMEDPQLSAFIKKGIHQEILPCIEMEDTVKHTFANSVCERFLNPFVKHYLLDISMNSISKFKARIMPTLEDYTAKYEKLPDGVVYSLAAMIVFYKGGDYQIRDKEEVLEFMMNAWKETDSQYAAVVRILGNREFWGMDLNQVTGLSDRTASHVADILKNGINLNPIL